MRLKRPFSTTLTRVLIVMLMSFQTYGTFCIAQQKSSKKFKVVLDAGHGGSDPGKPSKAGYKEKDIALKIVLATGKALEKDPNIEVVYTRKTDKFIELKERGAIANRAEADLFISVHCNAHHTQAYGAETYVLGLHRNETNFNVAKAENEVILLEENYEENYAQYDINSPESFIGLTLLQEQFLEQSIELAASIQDNFRERLKRKDRSVKQAGFIVLHQTVMPSVLVETGFITNKKEGAYLNSKKGQTELASAISKAVIVYKDKLVQDPASILQATSDSTEEVTTSDQIFEDTIFKVQIAASGREIETKSYNFKGLSTISRKREGPLYKYYYGSTSNYTEVKKLLQEAKRKGYDSAFIVSFNKNNIQIPLKQVLN